MAVLYYRCFVLAIVSFLLACASLMLDFSRYKIAFNLIKNYALPCSLSVFHA